MTIYVTEKEMIERFVDGLKKSASCAKQMITEKVSDQPSILKEFMEGLKVAAGSAHQLAHAQENPFWLRIRDFIERCIELAPNIVLTEANNPKLWESMITSLDSMQEKGKKMATAKALLRSDALIELSVRKNLLDKKLAAEQNKLILSNG